MFDVIMFAARLLIVDHHSQMASSSRPGQTPSSDLEVFVPIESPLFYDGLAFAGSNRARLLKDVQRLRSVIAFEYHFIAHFPSSQTPPDTAHPFIAVCLRIISMSLFAWKHLTVRIFHRTIHANVTLKIQNCISGERPASYLSTRRASVSMTLRRVKCSLSLILRHRHRTLRRMSREARR